MRAKIKPIVPRKMLCDTKALEAGIERALDRCAAESKQELEKTVSTWETPVRFTVRKLKYGRSVGTSSKIFGYVDQGTRAHTITARRAPFLAFKAGGFRPKTKVTTIASYKGARGQHWRRARSVSHPGTQARNFTAVINTRNRQRFGRYLKQEIGKAVKR